MTIRPLWMALACACIAGCGHQAAFVNPEADFGFYEVVAIAPFDNLSAEPTAAAAVARVFRTRLWARGFWQVVSEGDWAQAETDVRKELGLERGTPLSSQALLMIGEKVGAQGIFLGSVRTYAMQRVGQDEYPLVALSFQFVDAPTGTVIWDASMSERGGPKFPFFGFGETHTLAELTDKLCAKALSGLRQ